MKKVILFSLMAMFLMSCGGAGQQPDDYITFGRAWNHVAQSAGYWVFIVIALALVGGYILAAVKGWIETFSLPLMFALVGFLLFAIFFRPCEVAANTTVEQAARGVFIGY